MRETASLFFDSPATAPAVVSVCSTTLIVRSDNRGRRESYLATPAPELLVGEDAFFFFQVASCKKLLEFRYSSAFPGRASA